MTGTDAKILVRQTAGITTIQLNRPEKLNAIDREMLDELDEQTSLLHRDESVRVVVLTGSGERAFCVGADLNQVATFEPTDIRRWVIDGMQQFRMREAIRAYQEGQVDLRGAAERAKLPIAVLLEEMRELKVAVLDAPDGFGPGLEALRATFGDNS